MLVGILNRAWADGVPTDSKLWPVVQLEKWPKAENVMGIAAGTPLSLLGSAVLRAHFSDIDARAPGAEVLVRCNIFPQGSTDWHGIIISAEALDCKERGGLGHKVTQRELTYLRVLECVVFGQRSLTAAERTNHIESNKQQ